MKNLFFTVAAVVALTFTLASCTKDRTCTCTDSDGDTYKVTYKKVTKKMVRDEGDCVSTSTTYTSGGTTSDAYVETCVLE